MNNHSTLLLLRRNWARGVAALLLVLALSAIITAITPPTYESQARVYVATGSGASEEALTAGGQFSLNIVASLAEVVLTPAVTGPAAEQLGGGITSDDVASSLSVSSSADTVLISITASADSPASAAAIANATASTLADIAPQLASGRTTNAVPVDVSIVQPAVSVPQPVSPNLRLNTALGLIAGVILALIVIAISEATRTRVRTDEEVEDLTRVPLIGHIPFDTRTTGSAIGSKSASLTDERFRSLRASLRYVIDMTEQPAVMVTSSIEGEGKSTVVAHLALALAGIDLKVLVVDADLRRPSMHTLLGLDGTVGLSDVLSRFATLEQAVQHSAQPGLDLLPSGEIPPNPSELLSGSRWAKLIAHLKSSYDIVLIDTPPTLPVSDPTLVASEVDHVLFVVASRRTRRAQVAAAIRKLSPALPSAQAMSTVVNMAVESELGGSYRAVAGTTRKRRWLRPLIG